MPQHDIVIVSALRTPIGNLGGSLSSISAHAMASSVFKALLQATNTNKDDISEVIMGQVLAGGSGQGPARQAAILAGLRVETPAWAVNQICGSGLKAIGLGAESIMLGHSNIVIAGGMESMSQSCHAIRLREGVKFGNASLIDMMMEDGLTDAFSKQAMGITAENIVAKYGFTRQEQDAFALSSQHKAEQAIVAGKFNDEIVPITIKVKKEDKIIDTDEFPRKGITIEALSSLRPAFKSDGSVTAGNSSGINDGAAAVMLMTRDEAQKRGLEILGAIKSFAHAGVDPSIMGTGPIPAVKAALKKANWQVQDLELIEANEAFAAQAMSVNKDLGLNESIVNVNGGAIALGHPIGASGARIMVTLLHEMKRRGSKKGLATLCVGGGMGVAMCIERD